MTRKTRRNIRLVVAYDGTGYGGWQRQDNAPSVQAELEKALAKMHGSSPPVFAAGRTDAGVHAQAQVANFYTDIGSIPAERFVPALNKLLPRDIRVMSATEVPLDFHSRFDARLRRYRYFIVIGRTVDPFALRTAWQVTRSPDLRALNEAASLLLGENDFTALCSARDPSPSKRRTVLEASFRWEGGTPGLRDRRERLPPPHGALHHRLADPLGGRGWADRRTGGDGGGDAAARAGHGQPGSRGPDGACPGSLFLEC